MESWQRHLFWTDDFVTVKVHELLGVCHVRLYSSVSHDLPGWLSASPDHFYVKYRFPSLMVTSWAQKRELGTIKVCADCCLERRKEMDNLIYFSAITEKRPLCGLDLCAGSGAFSKAMEETAGVKFKYAIELSPSAAQTMRHQAFS
jgi:DNA (cytosine-5)-methyltransferase 1